MNDTHLALVCDAHTEAFFGDQPLRCDMTGVHQLHHDPVRNVYWLNNLPYKAPA